MVGLFRGRWRSIVGSGCGEELLGGSGGSREGGCEGGRRPAWVGFWGVRGSMTLHGFGSLEQSMI